MGQAHPLLYTLNRSAKPEYSSGWACPIHDLAPQLSISNKPASYLRSRNRPCPDTLPCSMKEVRAISVAVIRVL